MTSAHNHFGDGHACDMIIKNLAMVFSFNIFQSKLLVFVLLSFMIKYNYVQSANTNKLWLKDYNSDFHNMCKNNDKKIVFKNSILLDNNICNTFHKNILLLRNIEKKYQKDGYFSRALADKDISYQEVVSFLAYLNINYGDVFPVDHIINSIRWSFNNLRETNGGFQQKGIVNASVRTSLYIFSIVNACIIDERIAPICKEFSEDILKSAKWVSKFKTPWAGNHDLAALLMFYQLFELTKNVKILKMFELKREKILNGFVHIDNNFGYWPEAPKSWKNRMLTPYLQIQLIFAGHYLTLNPLDKEIRKLYVKQAKLFETYADMNQLKLNVEDSYHYKENERDKWISLGQPAIVYHLCLHANIYCDYTDNIDHKNLFFKSMLSNFERDEDVTLFSDSFLRFGVIIELSDLIRNSNN